MIADGFFTAYALHAAFALVAVGLVLAFVRLVRGPSTADRIVALDLITVQAVAFMGLYCIRTGTSAFLDMAIALALVGFLGTVAFSRYVERAARLRLLKQDAEDAT